MSPAHNRPQYYFCCIVECVKYYRAANEVLVYIDVRGETDLRRPNGSSLVLRNSFGSVQVRPSRGMEPAVDSRPSRFDPDQRSTSRHHKGCLVFPAPEAPGMYTFCYANAYQHHHTDYLPVTLFEIPEGPNGLKIAFGMGAEETCYTFHESPFAEDTPQAERARWEATVPEQVMNRGSIRGPSWSRVRRGDWYI